MQREDKGALRRCGMTMARIGASSEWASRALGVGLQLMLRFASSAIIGFPSADAQSTPAYVYNSPLLPLVLQMPDNGWLEVNANRFSDVWTPPALEPLKDNVAPASPDRIIGAWSGFAWDSNRGDLILYGGGHANYPGNDVYRWHSGTLQWERASLPSEIYNDPVSGYRAIDGVDNAPSAAHTYKNNTFLPLADRFLTWGGAAYNNGGPYLRPSESNPSVARTTGPYLFDPNRANGDEVGGTTGSHVQRVAPYSDIVGGRMWQNRDVVKNVPGQAAPLSHVNGCAAYANENGVDAVYVAAANLYASNLDLYRYQLTTLGDPSQDQFAKVGMFWNGSAGMTSCAYDASRQLFVRTNAAEAPFAYWDLTTPGATNADHLVAIEPSIAALQSWLAANGFDIHNCGLEFDPVRRTFPLWCGGTAVWDLQPPAGGNVETGWTAMQRASPSPAAPPTPETGVLGKWRYAPFYDVFVALENADDGNVWIYKRSGWVQPRPPGDALPTVSLTSPAAGTTFAPGEPIALSAAAFDSDGTIARVEYYANGVRIGQSSVAPYTLPFNPILVGSYALSAIAVDNVGGMAKSAVLNVAVDAPLTTRVLQRGLGGYAAASDTTLDAYAPTTPEGATASLYLDASNYVPLIRFAVFASEGGPVPDGAVVQSATLSLAKQYYAGTFALNALLGDWNEQQTTWSQRTSGIPWALPGARAAGIDYEAASDDTIDAPFNAGWIDFDVTARARQWAAGSRNFGWRVTQLDSAGNAKIFDASEYAADPSLRPKLTVVYSSGASFSAVYRFRTSAYHFYTASESEKNYLLQSPGYVLEGVGFYASLTSVTGTLPVYRFSAQTYHFYTISETEKNYVLQNYPNFTLEGVAFYAWPTSVSGTLPVYRFNTGTYHFYTISESEKNYVLQNYPNFTLEGIAFYARTGP